MERYMLDLGEGILVRGSQVTAVLPNWLVQDIELPEGVPTPTCWVELEGGRPVPCFKPHQELLDFIAKVGSPTSSW